MSEVVCPVCGSEAKNFHECDDIYYCDRCLIVFEKNGELRIRLKTGSGS